MTVASDLADAEAAYHKLMTGRSARVFVDSNGERVEYTAASADKLANYIRSLKQQLGAVTFAPLSPYFR